MSDIADRIFETFAARGDLAYGSEAVTQRQHALQAATLALDEGAANALVVAALLHDIGHILETAELPRDDAGDLDDAHEDRAAAWLARHFGPPVADPVRLHVAAKRYLCTIDPGYADTLSPASHKSYLDQGGPMTAVERAAFEAEAHFEDAVRLRRWDDRAKDPACRTAPLDSFRGLLTDVLTGG